MSYKTSIGLPENIVAALTYLGGWLSGILFLLIERKNKFVRFHAFQSIIVFGVITLIGIIFTPIPVIGAVISWLASIIGFVLWILLMVLASQGKKYKMRWAGDLAEKWAGD